MDVKTGLMMFRMMPIQRGMMIVIMRNTKILIDLSSPRAKRAGPKGLRAESARAVTGRRCPHSGVGEDFLVCQPVFFTKRAVSWKPFFDFPFWSYSCFRKKI